MTEKNMTEQLTVTTENEVSIISQNPFYINDLFLSEPADRSINKAAVKSDYEPNTNRSVNVVPSLKI